ncbi:MAG: hypothetical protein JXQ76_08435, partial [Campylobacterales bacterium]|nr:hypothetical protein [Campylobacterales bacterium]
DYSSINYLQIQTGACDCLGVVSANNNGSNGTTSGVNPVRLDFGTIPNATIANPQIKCGYFEVEIN